MSSRAGGTAGLVGSALGYCVVDLPAAWRFGSNGKPTVFTHYCVTVDQKPRLTGRGALDVRLQGMCGVSRGAQTLFSIPSHGYHAVRLVDMAYPMHLLHKPPNHRVHSLG